VKDEAFGRSTGFLLREIDGTYTLFQATVDNQIVV
jgi:hypothetical protein